jgi:hypothetical protein
MVLHLKEAVVQIKVLHLEVKCICCDNAGENHCGHNAMIMTLFWSKLHQTHQEGTVWLRGELQF